MVTRIPTGSAPDDAKSLHAMCIPRIPTSSSAPVIIVVITQIRLQNQLRHNPRLFRFCKYFTLWFGEFE